MQAHDPDDGLGLFADDSPTDGSFADGSFTDGSFTGGSFTGGSFTNGSPTDGVPSDDVSGRDKPGRRGLWIGLATFAAVTAVGVPVAVHLARSGPAALVTPAHLAGLTRDDDENATSTADYLRSAITAGMNLRSSVGAVYVDHAGDDAHSVIFVGGTSTKGSDESRLTALFGLLDDSTDGVTGIVTQDPGALGGQMKCGLTTDTSTADTTAADAEMAVCGWADSATVGIALFPDRPLDQAADLLRRMRTGLQGRQSAR